MLPKCCERAMERGDHREHASVCEHQPPPEPVEPEPEPDALFDLPDQPKQGGQHL